MAAGAGGVEAAASSIEVDECGGSPVDGQVTHGISEFHASAANS